MHEGVYGHLSGFDEINSISTTLLVFRFKVQRDDLAYLVMCPYAFQSEGKRGSCNSL